MPDAPSPSPRWLSLGPASRLVGVDPDTLRRWADEGRIEAYVTPGGHRRFERRPIERLVADPPGGHADRWPASAPAPTASRGPTGARYAADKATGGDVPADDDGRARALPARRPAAGRGARRPPRRRAGDGAARDRAEADAAALVDDLARRLAARGTSLTEAVALFVAARRPFLDELTGLGRRRTLDAARLAALYEDASGLLDRLLLRLIATFQEATRDDEPGGRPARR